MNEAMIIGLMITDRIKESGKTQEVLSNYAHLIRSRLGFHEVNQDVCSRTGIIVLQLGGNRNEWPHLLEALQQIGGVIVKSMTF